MSTNNAINAPFPFTTAMGGTGVSVPTNHGIMVSNGASPMSSVVLSNNQVLLGVTGAAPVPATITPSNWSVIVVPPGGPVDMLPFVTYVTQTIDIDRQTFNLPGSADVNVGDEFRICCYGVDATGFTVSGPNLLADTIWQGFVWDTIQPPRGIGFKIDANPTTPTVGSAHLICVDNSDPDTPQYMLLSATGAFSISS